MPAVYATRIAAPSPTQNKDGQRDPKIHQTQKVNQWHFGVDADSGLVCTIVGTATKVNDVTQASEMLHGEEQVVFAGSSYQDAHKRPEAKPGATPHIAHRRSSRKPCKKRCCLAS